MTNKTVVTIRVWVRALIKIYMRTRNYYRAFYHTFQHGGLGTRLPLEVTFQCLLSSPGCVRRHYGAVYVCYVERASPSSRADLSRVHRRKLSPTARPGFLSRVAFHMSSLQLIIFYHAP